MKNIIKELHEKLFGEQKRSDEIEAAYVLEIDDKLMDDQYSNHIDQIFIWNQMRYEALGEPNKYFIIQLKNPISKSKSKEDASKDLIDELEAFHSLKSKYDDIITFDTFAFMVWEPILKLSNVRIEASKPTLINLYDDNRIIRTFYELRDTLKIEFKATDSDTRYIKFQFDDKEGDQRNVLIVDAYNIRENIDILNK